MYNHCSSELPRAPGTYYWDAILNSEAKSRYLVVYFISFEMFLELAAIPWNLKRFQSWSSHFLHLIKWGTQKSREPCSSNSNMQKFSSHTRWKHSVSKRHSIRPTALLLSRYRLHACSPLGLGQGLEMYHTHQGCAVSSGLRPWLEGQRAAGTSQEWW